VAGNSISRFDALAALYRGKSPGFAPLKILSRLGCSCQYPALTGKIIGITLWHNECRLRLSIGGFALNVIGFGEGIKVWSSCSVVPVKVVCSGVSSWAGGLTTFRRLNPSSNASSRSDIFALSAGGSRLGGFSLNSGPSFGASINLAFYSPVRASSAVIAGDLLVPSLGTGLTRLKLPRSFCRFPS
jgi:hypothetical protein